MTHNFDLKTVKARKDHRCDLCEETIVCGLPYYIEKIVDSDGWETRRLHIVCHTVCFNDPDIELAETLGDQVDFFNQYLCDTEPDQLRKILHGQDPNEIERILDYRNRQLIHYGSDYNL